MVFTEVQEEEDTRGPDSLLGMQEDTLAQVEDTGSRVGRGDE